jgi:membrane protease YdiL (CAAX protease family)
MAKDRKTETEAAAGFWARYFRQSVRPLASLAFVLPLLLVYEVGVLVLGPDEVIRNGADVLMRQLLQLLGFGQYFLLPVATCIILLAWHHVRREPWRFSPRVLPVMFVESVVWGLLLFAVHCVMNAFSKDIFAAVAAPSQTAEKLANLVAFCGAGLYEEFLFRLILLSAAMGLIRLAGGTPRATAIVAVAVTSLVFSAAHYEPFMRNGEPFLLYTFVFRALAGIFFAVLYLRRGFGIAAGTHAFYDVITQLF